ncbi:hypothetical protein PVMG_05125 [Plasmodium vivax Mauritania I]|uniref:Variable surface protein Vir7-like protein n=1 Tax=Plasmodium vivax Mauritania I TaxID=1035515 RepID=A0A0J9TKA5_PLAVI|nr:hypothetical protein PVMG_05125 [Plasmodium vivax Mauritania I]
MANILGDDRLSLLRTIYNYRDFDKEKGTCDGVDFYNEANQELISYSGLQSVSEKILKAVCYVYNKSKTSEIDDDTCKFLYFWLGNTLINSLNKTMFFSGVIIKLYQRLNENGVLNICKIPYINMDEKDFQKIKLIFDYFQDYDDYNLDLALYNPPCNKEYNKYLTTYVNNYKELYNECMLKKQPHSYCTEFLKYYDAEKHDNLYSWKCSLTETLPKPEPSRGEFENEKQKAQLDESFGRGGLQQPLQRTNGRVQENQEITGLLTPDLIMREDSTVSTTPDGSPSTLTSKSITGAVSVAAALVPSYLLYNVISIMINKYNALLCTS